MSAGATDESINIQIAFSTELAGAIHGLLEVQNAVTDLGSAGETVQHNWHDVSFAINRSTEAMQVAISPVRSLSWDFLLMGRGLSILQTHFFKNNQALAEAIGIVYGFGAALRVIVTVVDVVRTAYSALMIIEELMTGKITIQAIIMREQEKAYHKAAVAAYNEAAAHTANAGAIGVETAARVAANIAMAATGGGPLGGGIFGAISPAFARAQGGGFVTQSGLVYVHKHETIIPASASIPNVMNEIILPRGPSASMINITLHTGPISSAVDVRKMLDDMGMIMAQESRRRMGR